MKHILRWIPLLVAVAGFYYLATRAKDVKTDELMAAAPSHLGISQKDWTHWTTVVSQIRDGHIPDLNAADWARLKGLCSSADAALRSQNIQLLGFLGDTTHKEQAIGISEKATNDSDPTVRSQALENLKLLGASDWLAKAKLMTSDSSKVVRDMADKLTAK